MAPGDLKCRVDNGRGDPTDGVSSGVDQILRFGDALDGRRVRYGRGLGEAHGETAKCGKDCEGESFNFRDPLVTYFSMSG